MVSHGILFAYSQETDRLFEPDVDVDDENHADGKSNKDTQIVMLRFRRTIYCNRIHYAGTCDANSAA